MQPTTHFRAYVFVLGLMLIALAGIPLGHSAPKQDHPNDNSDLNRDLVVDHEDLVLFSTIYLERDWESVDWCDFYEASSGDADLYGRSPDYYTKHFSRLLDYIGSTYCGDFSDFDGDGRISVRDLMAFSEDYAGEHFLRVDWCDFLQAVLDGHSRYGRPASHYLNHYGALLLFIQDRYTCSDAPPPAVGLALRNAPKFLTRIAASRDGTGEYYVTDAVVGSVFIYDSNLVLRKELRNLAKPLGIAVNSSGHILVGNDKRDNVEVYDPATGQRLAAFGAEEIEMPVSIMVDSLDRVYVTDARSNTIHVYGSDYQWLMDIGEPGLGDEQLRSPKDAVLSPDETEIYVLDGLAKRIQVFDLDGAFVRTIPLIPERCGWFGCSAGTARFTRSQALEMDAGNLHLLDIFDSLVAVLNSTGGIVNKYGAYGGGDGQFRTPMDFIIEPGRVLVADGSKNAVVMLPTQ